MEMLSKKLTAGLIPVGIVVSVALAALPAVASATTVTPAKTAITAKLAAGTESTFTTENGTGATVACKASATSGETPSSTLPESGPPFYNNNPHSEADTSVLAGGSVEANVSTPTFTECSSGAERTSVATNDTNGKWSLDWNVLNSSSSPWTVAAIGVPKAGAVITLEIAGLPTCHLTVDPETAQGVIGYWENGTSTTESKLYINEQVFYSGNEACESVYGIPNADSPAVFRASYTIAGPAGEGIIEKWS